MIQPYKVNNQRKSRLWTGFYQIAVISLLIAILYTCNADRRSYTSKHAVWSIGIDMSDRSVENLHEALIAFADKKGFAIRVTAGQATMYRADAKLFGSVGAYGGDYGIFAYRMDDAPISKVFYWKLFGEVRNHLHQTGFTTFMVEDEDEIENVRNGPQE